MGCVYFAWNFVRNKGYVGKTIHNFSFRKKAHIYKANKKPNTYFLRSLRKYSDGFVWSILVFNDNPDELNRLEQHYIKSMKTKVPDGYNLTDGGEGTNGYHTSDETKLLQSIKKIGKKQSLETRLKISKALMGNQYGCGPKSIEFSNKLKGNKNAVGNKGRLGQPHTEATKCKIGNSNRGKLRGRILSKEHAEKCIRYLIPENRKGIRLTEEHKLAISKAKTGKKQGPISNEQRIKLSKAMKGRPWGIARREAQKTKTGAI